MVHDSASAAPIQAGVARVFDEASGYYRQLRWERNRLVRVEKWLTQTTIEEELGDSHVSTALELGCGPGTWTGLLADRAERVLAVDLSESMLGQAREAMAQRSNVTLTQSDIARFNPGSEKFERILSVRVLEYVPEWQPVVEGLGRWLTPGGRAVVVTKTPISIWRGTGRERWFGPRTFARRLTRRSGQGRVRQSLGGEGGAGGSHTPSAVTTTLSNATGSFASSPTAPLLNVESLTRSI